MPCFLDTAASIILTCLLASSVAASSPPRPQDQSPPSDISLSITWNAYHKMALGTAVFVTGLGLAGVLAFFFPLLAYKVCYFLGGCQNTMDYYVDRFVAEGVEGAGKSKRSVDRFQPILISLAKAYQKYGDAEERARQEKEDADGGH